MTMLLRATAFLIAMGAAGTAGAQSDHDQHSGHGDGAEAAPAVDAESAARRAYEEAFDRMHGPMLEAAAEGDPDVAFVRGMIPHHQGAIDMARIVLQYGDDEATRSLAARIIEAQEAEIREMEAWLRAHAD